MKPPSEQSAKKRVSVVRDIPGLKSHGNFYQDPRFDAALGKADLAKTRANYSFLDDQRKRELDELKAQLKKCRDTSEREVLAKAIQSQQSRLETMHKRDIELKVMARVGSKKISRAKKREMVLAEQFKSLKSRDRAKVIEKRLQKTAQKEKKNLPNRRPQNQ